MGEVSQAQELKVDFLHVGSKVKAAGVQKGGNREEVEKRFQDAITWEGVDCSAVW